MKNIKSNFYLLFFLYIAISCKEEDNIVPIFGKVVEQQNQTPIDSAKIIYNAYEELFTDKNGEFRTTFNLGKVLADSISFYVAKDSFHSNNYSTIIGNTQKDIIKIELEKK